MVHPCLEAAKILEAQGLSAGVVNARFAKPLDRDWLVGVVRKTGLVITVEENTFIGGFGSGVREILEGEPVQVRVLGLPDAFLEHGPQSKLREKAGLTADTVAQRAFEFHKKFLKSN
jgi:1-deoxy-D-xylulose-5-phosphate synthase